MCGLSLSFNMPFSCVLADYCAGTSSKRTLERYRSPASGSTTTISLPLLSGRRPTRTAAATAAPQEMPQVMPFLAMQAPGHLDGFLVGDRLDLVDDVEVEHVGLEAGADPLDLVRPGLRRLARADCGQHRRGRRLDRDQLHRPPLLTLEVPADAGDRAARPDAGDEDVDRARRCRPRSRGRSS